MADRQRKVWQSVNTGTGSRKQEYGKEGGSMTKKVGEWWKKSLRNWKERGILKSLEGNFSKVKFYDPVLWKSYLAALGVLTTFITFLSLIDSEREIRFTAAGLVFILAVIFLWMWWSANHRNRAELIINRTRVVIREGDIFAALKEQRKAELSVIGVNDFFDTIADDKIVSRQTLHGKYLTMLEEMKGEGEYVNKLEALRARICKDNMVMGSENPEEEPKREPEREAGNQERYPIGSMMEFESYVLTAFTKFDRNDKAYLSAGDYTGFWMKFWENMDEIYAGRTLNIPLMGAGITRFRNGKPSKQELLEMMLWTLKLSGFHNTYGDKQINFIIYKDDMRDIDFYHLQHSADFR